MNPNKRTHWLTFAIIASFFAVAIFGIVSYVNTRTIRTSEQRVSKSYAVREVTNELLSSIKDMQTGQRGFLLTGERDYLQPYLDGLKQVEDHFAILDELTTGNILQTQHLVELRKVFEEKKAHLAKSIAMRENSNDERVSDAALAMVRSGRGEELMNIARKIVQDIRDEEAKRLAESEASSEFLTLVSESAITIGHFLALGLIVFAGYAAHVDRSKRDLAESKMQIQQNELAAVIDSAFEGIVAFNEDLTIRLINPAASKMFGVEPGDAIGRSILELTASNNQATFMSDVQCLLFAQRSSIEYPDGNGMRSDGSRFPFEGTLTKSATNLEKFCTLKIRDLSESKVSEEKRREHVAILQQLRDAVMVCDLDDQILSWNEGATTLFAVTEVNAIGKNACDLLFFDRPEVWNNGKESVLRTGEYSGEFKYVTHDGRELFIEQRRSLIHDSTNQPTAHLILSIDVSDRKSQEAKERRSQRLASIGTLAGGVAHDLNNVLTPILMSGKLLKRGSSNASRLIDTIVASAERGGRMIKKLLAFAGGESLELRSLDIREILTELEEILRHTLPQNIELNVHIPAELDRVEADSTELSQVIMNLTINARDAMPDGGRLVLDVRNRSVDSFQVHGSDSLKAGDHVLLTVTDTGHGIPEKVLDRIFDPFFTTKPQGKGTGLGLATSLGIIRSYGGDIIVESRPGHGAAFQVFLPASTSTEAVSPNVQLASDLPGGKGELILIVDDESLIVDTARETLETRNYRVLTASSGQDAIALFQMSDPQIDLVLLDMMMPGMDGRATKDAIHSYNAKIRIIACSGLRRPESVVGESTDMNGFLAKPYSDDQLLRLVRQVLDSRTNESKRQCTYL